MKKKVTTDFTEQLINDLRQEISAQEQAPVLEQPKAGRELRSRQLPRHLILGMALLGVIILGAAIYVVRVQQAHTAAANQPPPSQFTVEGEWLTPGPPPPLVLPEQQPIAAPPLPTPLPTPPVDMYSPLPPHMVQD